MTKKILTIGLELASEDAKRVDFDSKVSLLDWDVIIFKPDISDGIYGAEDFQGKPSLGESASFKLKENCEHWRREIKQAVESGKNVFVFLAALYEVYVDTGRRTYSGTGRNRSTTTIVEIYNNYATIPADLSPVNANGKAMKLINLGAEVLAPYWDAFAEHSSYCVLISSETPGICLTTKNGDKPVGAIARSKRSNGALVLMPDIEFYGDEFLKDDESQEMQWTSEAEIFAVRFLSSIINLDKALKSTTEVTPAPLWTSDSTYLLELERALKLELLEAERRLEEAQRAKEAVQERLNAAGTAKVLLYEKGKPLEAAIVNALITLGFAASPFKEGSSEFDVVFECGEGRLLGEAEGKDSKAINVDKLRQLSMNIHEDLQREEVFSPAKGVLFGNGFRLTAPVERTVQFTDKCITAAVSQATALVPTSSLFNAVQYLSSNDDENYATQCRSAILLGVGVVLLPVPPMKEKGAATEDLKSGERAMHSTS